MPAGNALQVAPTLSATLRGLISTESSTTCSEEARGPRNVFIHVDEPQGVELELWNWRKHINKTHAGGSALIIQDIDIIWADQFLAWFAGSLSPTFFANHMARLDSSSTPDETVPQVSENFERLRASLKQYYGDRVQDSWCSSDESMMRLLTSGLEKDGKGLYVDCDFSSSMEQAERSSSSDLPGSASGGVRWTLYGRSDPKDSHRRSVRTRISWCPLKDHVCKTR